MPDRFSDLSRGTWPPKEDPLKEPPRSMRKVPEKPTRQMIEAAMRASGLSSNDIWTIWQAMLQAAPQTASGFQESEIDRAKELAGIKE